MSKPQDNQVGFPSDDYNGVAFLFKKVRISHTSLAYWMTVPEFVQEITLLQKKSETINEEVVFRIMQRIYREKESDKAEGIQYDFKFQPARHAMRMLSEVLTGSRENWNK